MLFLTDKVVNLKAWQFYDMFLIGFFIITPLRISEGIVVKFWSGCI